MFFQTLRQLTRRSVNSGINLAPITSIVNSNRTIAENHFDKLNNDSVNIDKLKSDVTKWIESQNGERKQKIKLIQNEVKNTKIQRYFLWILNSVHS